MNADEGRMKYLLIGQATNNGVRIYHELHRLTRIGRPQMDTNEHR
jgi:hypothetical protein